MSTNSKSNKLNLKPYQSLRPARPSKKAVQPSWTHDYIDYFEVINQLERSIIEHSEDFPDEEYSSEVAKLFIQTRPIIKDIMERVMDGASINHFITSPFGKGFLIATLYTLMISEHMEESEEQDEE